MVILSGSDGRHAMHILGYHTFVRRLRGAMDRNIEISQIFFMRDRIDTRYSGSNISINDPYRVVSVGNR